MSRLVSTTLYVTNTADLENGGYTVGEDIFLDLATLRATNNSTDQLTGLAVVGVLVEAPDTSALGAGIPPRMVLRLTVTSDLLDVVKRILNSTDL